MVTTETINGRIFKFELKKVSYPKGWEIMVNDFCAGWTAGSKKDGESFLKEIINECKNI